MKELLEKFGFKYNVIHKEWNKLNWTIRLYGDNVEVFNDPLPGEGGKYFNNHIDKEDFPLLLEEIDEFINIMYPTPKEE